MNKLVFSKRANTEILQSYLYYEEQQGGLGERFVNEVIVKAEQVKLFPKRYSSNKLPFRETMIKGFPFLIIYRYNSSTKYVFISSVFHSKRNPNKKYL